jgi:hypothetical protein
MPAPPEGFLYVLRCHGRFVPLLMAAAPEDNEEEVKKQNMSGGGGGGFFSYFRGCSSKASSVGLMTVCT